MNQQNKKLPRRQITGILICDKPSGWTSHDVVAKIRGYFRLSKLGHAGTLDPIATGVLVLLAGRATKIADVLLADDKEYRFGLRIGMVTDSQDITGKIIRDDDIKSEINKSDIENILDDFRGDIMQLPPMFSSVKVNGQRLYKLGRKGKVVERKPRNITIKSLELEKIEGKIVTLHVTCSKGTYVRTLCHDIGEKLGTGGCMESLIRLRSGAYEIKNAYKIDDILSWSPEELESKMLPLP